MGSVTISEMIILMAATVMAGSFAAYAIFYGNLIQSNIASSMDAVRQQVNIRIKIIYATVNESESCFIIYVKNIGHLPILNSSFPYMDLYVGPYKRAALYKYNPGSPRAGFFLILDADGDYVWEAGETAIFKAFYDGTLNGSELLYEARICLRNGLGDSHLFTLPI